MSCSLSPENIVNSYFWVVFVHGILLASISAVGLPAEYQVPRQPELQPIRSQAASNGVEGSMVALAIHNVQSLEISEIETAIKEVLAEMLDGSSLVDFRNLTKKNIIVENTTRVNETVQTNVGVEIPEKGSFVPANQLQLFLTNNLNLFKTKLEEKLESSAKRIAKVEVPDWTAAIIAVFSLLLVVLFIFVIRNGCLGDEELFDAEKNSTGAPTSVEDGWASADGLPGARKRFSQQYLVNGDDDRDTSTRPTSTDRRQSTEL